MVKIHHQDWMRVRLRNCNGQVDDGRLVDKGDPVKVKGLRGTYRFVSLTTNLESREQWVDVVQHKGIRSVDPERVR